MSVVIVPFASEAIWMQCEGILPCLRGDNTRKSNSDPLPKDPNRITQPEKLLPLTGDWKSYLKEAQGHPGNEFEHHERTGRPLGDERFIEKAERLLHRELKKKKPGPKEGGRDN